MSWTTIRSKISFKALVRKAKTYNKLWHIHSIGLVVKWKLNTGVLLFIICVGACVCAQLLSCVRHFVSPWTVAHQAPLSMGFPRQEYWSRLLFPLPEDLLDAGIWTHISCISCMGKLILYHWATWETSFLYLL